MKQELRRFLESFGYAARGIRLCLRERNFRFHLCAAVYVAAFGGLAGFSRERFAVLFLCFALMLGMEAMNTAVESVCDRITGKREESIRNIKDVAAGAVLCCAIFCAGIGVLFFADRTVWQNIGETLSRHTGYWLPLVLSVPAALGFIFLIGRKK